jgi:hypothetical protein
MIAQSSVRQRGSVSSRFANALQRTETQITTSSRLRSNSSPSADSDEEHMIEHPVEPRATTAMLPPVMSKVVDPDPLCWLEFTEDSIFTSCKSGKFSYIDIDWNCNLTLDRAYSNMGSSSRRREQWERSHFGFYMSMISMLMDCN